MSGAPTGKPADRNGSAELPPTIIETGAAALEGLVPPDLREEAVQRVLSAVTNVSIRQTSIETQFSGHIPPPSMIEHYERIHPGLADRLMTMAERAQQAEIDSTNDVNRRTDRYQLLALGAGCIGLVAILAVATFLALHGHDWVAAGVLGIGVSGIVATLVNAPSRGGKRRLDDPPPETER